MEEAEQHEDNGAAYEEITDPEELRSRLEIKYNHLREMRDEITRVRISADEARAGQEAVERRLEERESERERLRERVRSLEEESRGRRLRRESHEREAQRLEREIERLKGEISRREALVQRREREIEALNAEANDLATRKETALQEALRRIEGLERDLEERESEAAGLRATIDSLRDQIEEERELHRRLAEPANRLRAGIDLFNESEHLKTVGSLSRTLGQPEVHVALGEGGEPEAMLQFTWRGITWQTYASNPGPAVEEPRVYLESHGEDLSGVERESPNARIGPGGKVFLGL